MTAGCYTARDTQRRPFSSPLGRLNQRFHEGLAAGRADQLERINQGEVPVALRLDDRLIWAHGASVLVTAVNGAEYHLLKALAHLPVLAHLGSVEFEAAPAAICSEALEGYRRFLRDRSVDVDLYIGLVTQLASDTLDDADYGALASVQKKLVCLAAENEVAQLVKSVAKAREELAAAGCWERTHFVVSGGNQPRYKHLTKNFFNRLLEEETGSGDAAIQRVLYSETCDSLAAAKGLVADRLVNRGLAEVFMDSPLSLHSDVLGDAGLAEIDRVFSGSAFEDQC